MACTARSIISAVCGTVITGFLDLRYRRAREYCFRDMAPPEKTVDAVAWKFDSVLDLSLAVWDFILAVVVAQTVGTGPTTAAWFCRDLLPYLSRACSLEDVYAEKSPYNVS